jgi:murein DD-endopeptidase MepM/ murein hydrolase activator NlpD
MIGLAISMSATSFLLANQHKAIAADSNLVSLSSLTTADQDPPQPVVASQASPTSSEVKLAAPAIKHEVKQGESLWQLAKEYKIAPEQIAASNKIAPKANLLVGQTLKIPSLEETETPEAAQVQASLQNLKESKTRLKTSLAALKSEESNLKSQLAAGPVKVSDATQIPQTQPTLTALSPNSNTEGAIEIAVPAPETEMATSNLDTGKAIPVPVPPTRTSPQETARLNTSEKIPTPVPKVPDLRTSRRETGDGVSPSEALPVAKRETVTPPTPQEQQALQLNRPVPIPVPSPQTAALSTNRRQDLGVTTPEVDNQSESAIPRQPSRELPKPQVITPAAERLYQVQVGDTLNSIARRHGVSVTELLRANNLSNPNLIKVSQSLIVPNAPMARSTRPTSVAALPRVPEPSEAPAPIAQTSPETPSQRFSRANQSAPTIDLPVEVAQESYTQKLKADINSLQKKYRNQSQPVTIPVEAPESNFRSPAPVASDSVNPDWRSNSSAWRNSRTAERNLPVSRNREQLVGVAPNDPEIYNDSIQIPVGESVGPDLPPLSVPDQYLPDAPMNFTGYIWPTKGVITSGYGRRWGRMHKGIDIAAPIGTPVFAAASGQVISAGWNSGGYGNLVKVRHPDGSVTYYAHNSRLLVREGQIVEQGQQISEMGSTGRSTGPHLHFEVRPDGSSAVNPIAYLPPRSRS